MKKELFTRLDDIVKPEGILATNTSTLPVVELAVATERPSQVVGIHFFNPAPMMSLVEVVRPMTASDDTVAAAKAFATDCGKDVVEVKDRAGFIVNALLFPYLNNAVRMLEAGTASRDDIDTAMKGGCNFPMGPLALLDLVGLDTSLSILDALYDEFRDPNYAAMPLLRRMVAAGQLGRKSGAGFFDYSQEVARPSAGGEHPPARRRAPPSRRGRAGSTVRFVRVVWALARSAAVGGPVRSARLASSSPSGWACRSPRSRRPAAPSAPTPRTWSVPTSATSSSTRASAAIAPRSSSARPPAWPTYTSDDLLVATLDDGAPRPQGVVDSPGVYLRMSDNGRYTTQDRPVVHEGRMIRSGREAFVNREAADAFDLQVGDEVPLSFWAPSFTNSIGTVPTTSWSRWGARRRASWASGCSRTRW